MLFIIALAIYDGGMGVSVPTFLLGLIVWYASFFASGYADADDIIGLNRLQAVTNREKELQRCVMEQICGEA